MLRVNKPKAFKTAALFVSTSLLVTSFMPLATANAHEIRQQRGYETSQFHHNRRVNRRQIRHNRRVENRRRHHRRRNDTGKIIAAGVIGLAIGAILSNSYRNNRSRDRYPLQAATTNRNPIDLGNGAYDRHTNYSTQYSVPGTPRVIRLEDELR